MKKAISQTGRNLFFILLLIKTQSGYAQDSLTYVLDSSFFVNIENTRLYGFSSFQHLSHYPEKEDRERYRSQKKLINQLPTPKNAATYYSLACSLWELNKLTEAERMFLNIVASKVPYFTTTYHSASDVAGDTSTKYYGYGSVDYHYKNSASIYLTEIYIQKKQFRLALQHLDNAVKKYKTTYNCGTGYNMQQDRYRFLYATCYDGLREFRKTMDLLLPYCFNRGDERIIQAIKSLYSPNQIKAALLKAERSITCTIDTNQPHYEIFNLHGDSTKLDTIWYQRGKGAITLFGKKIDLPFPNLQPGEPATREHYLIMFKESDFYTSLQQAPAKKEEPDHS